MDPTSLKRSVREIVATMPEIRLVYLFGSRVDGQIGEQSDYDLAILVDDSAKSQELQAQFQHAMATALNTSLVDVLLLHQAPVELAFSVIAQGILLYESDVTSRVEYEATVMGKYGDYLPVLRAQRRDILYEALLRMGELGVIPAEFALKLAPMAGFRNILVHEYLGVSWDTVYANLHKLEDLEQFSVLVRQWLADQADQGDSTVD